MGYGVVVLDPDPDEPRRPRRRPAPLPAAYTDERALDELAATCARRDDRVRERAGGGARAAGADRRASARRSARWRSRRTGSPRRRFLQRVRVRDGAVPPGARSATELGRRVAPDPSARPAQDQPAGLRRQGPGDRDRRGRRPPRHSSASAGVAVRARGTADARDRALRGARARAPTAASPPFPPGENRHRDGILETTVVPARVSRRAGPRGARASRSPWPSGWSTSACWASSCSSPTAGGCTSTRWRPARTTAATTRWTRARSTSSSSSSAPSAGSRWASRAC